MRCESAETSTVQVQATFIPRSESLTLRFTGVEFSPAPQTVWEDERGAEERVERSPRRGRDDVAVSPRAPVSGEWTRVTRGAHGTESVLAVRHVRLPYAHMSPFSVLSLRSFALCFIHDPAYARHHVLTRDGAGMKTLEGLHADFPRSRLGKPFPTWLGDVQTDGRREGMKASPMQKSLVRWIDSMTQTEIPARCRANAAALDATEAGVLAQEATCGNAPTSPPRPASPLRADSLAACFATHRLSPSPLRPQVRPSALRDPERARIPRRRLRRRR